ncbi:MAG: AAA family ATPase [Armatimonadota bacterium]
MDERDGVLLLVENPELRETLLRVLETEDFGPAVVAYDHHEAVQLAKALRLQLIMLSESKSFAWPDLCNFLTLASPASWIMLVLDVVDKSAIDTAMLRGVRQVVTSSECPLILPGIVKALRDLKSVMQSDEYARATDPLRAVRLIAVSGAKGGIGKTTFAVNLGVALSQKNAGPVVIWDGYCHFGDVAGAMSLPETRTISELSDLGEDVDDDLILSYAIHHESGPDVLLTSGNPVPLDLLSERFVERVIHALRKKYRFIVVDTPPIIHPISAVVFARCSRLFVVTTLRDVASVGDAIKLIKMLEGKRVRAASIFTVTNRVAKADAVKESEVEALMATTLAGSIPEDPLVVQAGNLGKPICQMAPHSPASRAIVQIADHILADASKFDR